MVKKPTRRKPQDVSVKVHWLEWALAGAAALAVLSLFGYLVYDALSAGDSGPVLELQRGEMSGTAPQYLEVVVSNTGSGTAADVEIEGEAETSSGEQVTAHVTLDYAPAGSTKTVTLVFSAGIKENRVDLRIAGFRDP